MKTLITPPADTPLSFAVVLGGIAGTPHERKNTAAEALTKAREMASAGHHVRVFQEIAFTIDPSETNDMSGNPAFKPDHRDALIRRLVNLLNKAGMEVLEERMPSLIDITETLIEAKALGYVPTGSKAEPIKYPDTPIGRLLKKQHENEREELRKRQAAERSECD